MTNENNPLQAIADVIEDVADVGFKALDTISDVNNAQAFIRLINFCSNNDLKFSISFDYHQFDIQLIAKAEKKFASEPTKYSTWNPDFSDCVGAIIEFYEYKKLEVNKSND